jgi:hypothetical protein
MKTVKFQNKYRIPTNRLPGFDYGANGFFMVRHRTFLRLFFSKSSKINSPNPLREL